MTEVLNGFVVLEGLDGAGTTTQLRLLEQRFVAAGVRGHCTCEPTDGAVGALIRGVLRGALSVEPRALALLFAADRWQHVNAPLTGVRERVASGEIVVSDRYLYSSLAYQGVEWSFEGVLALHAGFPLPGDVVYVDTPVEVCQGRLAARGERDLFDAAAFQRRVADAYERAFAAFASAGVRFHRIDGRLNADRIADRVWKVVEGLPIIKA
jgi:dTMP kinase